LGEVLEVGQSCREVAALDQIPRVHAKGGHVVRIGFQSGPDRCGSVFGSTQLAQRQPPVVERSGMPGFDGQEGVESGDGSFEFSGLQERDRLAVARSIALSCIPTREFRGWVRAPVFLPIGA
jgi:hypothetical protein